MSNSTTPSLNISSDQLQQVRIISSSKIQNKVNQVLDLILSDDVVVVELSAKSEVASKLISIVEIVKREAASRLEKGDEESPKENKRLHQYSSLHESPATHKHPNDEHNRSLIKQPQTSETEGPITWTKEIKQSPISAQSVPVEGEGRETDANPHKKRKTKAVGDESEDDFFENMAPMTERLLDAAAQEEVSKPHPVPVLKIYLSLKPIQQLREAYGEQCVP